MLGTNSCSLISNSFISSDRGDDDDDSLLFVLLATLFSVKPLGFGLEPADPLRCELSVIFMVKFSFTGFAVYVALKGRNECPDDIRGDHSKN